MGARLFLPQQWQRYRWGHQGVHREPMSWPRCDLLHWRGGFPGWGVPFGLSLLQRGRARLEPKSPAWAVLRNHRLQGGGRSFYPLYPVSALV